MGIAYSISGDGVMSNIRERILSELRVEWDEDFSATEIAERHGVPVLYVLKIARDTGITFPRGQDEIERVVGPITQNQDLSLSLGEINLSPNKIRKILPGKPLDAVARLSELIMAWPYLFVFEQKRTRLAKFRIGDDKIKIYVSSDQARIYVADGRDTRIDAILTKHLLDCLFQFKLADLSAQKLKEIIPGSTFGENFRILAALFHYLSASNGDTTVGELFYPFKNVKIGVTSYNLKASGNRRRVDTQGDDANQDLPQPQTMFTCISCLNACVLFSERCSEEAPAGCFSIYRYGAKEWVIQPGVPSYKIAMECNDCSRHCYLLGNKAFYPELCPVVEDYFLVTWVTLEEKIDDAFEMVAFETHKGDPVVGLGKFQFPQDLFRKMWQVVSNIEEKPYLFLEVPEGFDSQKLQGVNLNYLLLMPQNYWLEMWNSRHFPIEMGFLICQDSAGVLLSSNILRGSPNQLEINYAVNDAYMRGLRVLGIFHTHSGPLAPSRGDLEVARSLQAEFIAIGGFQQEQFKVVFFFKRGANSWRDLLDSDLGFLGEQGAPMERHRFLLINPPNIEFAAIFDEEDCLPYERHIRAKFRHYLNTFIITLEEQSIQLVGAPDATLGPVPARTPFPFEAPPIPIKDLQSSEEFLARQRMIQDATWYPFPFEEPPLPVKDLKSVDQFIFLLALQNPQISFEELIYHFNASKSNQSREDI